MNIILDTELLMTTGLRGKEFGRCSKEHDLGAFC